MSADSPSGTFPATGHTAAPSVPAGPQVGDIVIYIHDTTIRRHEAWQRRKDAGTEFIVTRTETNGVEVHEVRRDDDEWRDSDWFFAARSEVRVVLRASYTEVPS